MSNFYPSRKAVFAAALGIPLAMAAALAAPALWVLGPLWSLLVLGAMAADFVLGASAKRLAVTPQLPLSMGVNRTAPAHFALAFAGAAPAFTEAELESDDRFAVAPARQALVPGAAAEFQLTPLRRGEGKLKTLWLRWTGPLGLVWMQRAFGLDRAVPILPDIDSVREEAVRLFQRDANAGLHMQLNRGIGSEFHALRDFQKGHDPRQIDWKQSARHNALIVKEFRVEQNQHIVAMLDTGRLMSEPLMGQPRLDRALHAILLLSYVSLKLGDRVALAAFDSKPRLSSGAVSGVRAFGQLQRLAAALDYSDEETNFTLGLTQLSADLEHRSVIFIFTDFADTTSAELMLENIARLLARHTVLFVLFRDEEVESMRAAEPGTPEDATRAVIADMLARERDIVLGRLRQMGVRIVDVPLTQMSAGVLNAYLAHKQRFRL
jgi:uncharacterized protein (DUF58 family)